MSDIARIVKLHKAKLGLTNKDLAEKTGLPENTIARICCGSTKCPTLKTIKLLAKALDCKISDLTSSECDDKLYFLDKKTSAIALGLKENPDLKNLYDAVKGMSPEELQTLTSMVNMIKRH